MKQTFIMQIRRVRPAVRQSVRYGLARPELLFVILAAVFGTVIVFRMAPLTGTDEFTHFPRVYQITEGTFRQQPLPAGGYGGRLPDQIVAMTDDYRDLSRKPDSEFKVRSAELRQIYGARNDPGSDHRWTDFTSDVVYPPWSFAAPVIGVGTAQLLGVPLVWYVYGGRLASLVLYIALVWGALRLLPGGKWLLVVIALLPTSLTQAATIGLDGTLNGTAWLLIAAVIGGFNAKRLSGRWLALLAGTSVAVASIKLGYLFLAALPLVLPAARLPGRATVWRWRAGLTALIALATAVGMFYASLASGDANLTKREGVYINANAQLAAIIEQPISHVWRVLIQPFTKSFDTVYIGLVGIVSNRLIYLSILTVVLLYLALYISAANAGRLSVLVPYRRRLLTSAVGVLVGTSLLISTAVYMTFNQVGSPVIEGLYGRYYLPLLPLLLFVPLTLQPAIRSLPAGSRVPLAVMGLVLWGLVSTVSSLG